MIVVLCAMQLASCNATRDVKLYKVSMGMTKKEVQKAVGKKPDNSICAKSYPDGHVEVVQYSRFELDGSFNPRLRTILVILLQWEAGQMAAIWQRLRTRS